MRSTRETQTANIRLAQMEAFMFPFMRMVAGISMALAVGYGGYIAIMGRIDVGQFSSFIMFLNNLIWPMAAIGRIINILTQGSASIERLETVLNAQADICDGPRPSPRDPQGSVEARDLTFAYPGADKPALEHVSFRLEKDRPLGVVGRTGSGKTTLVNLIMRIFDPGEGYLHRRTGDPTIPLKDLRQACGYVPQDNFLFSDTISANIAFGDRSKTQAQIEEAAKAACVHDNIVDFADGYDYPGGRAGRLPSPAGRSAHRHRQALILDRRSSSGRFGLRRGYRHRGKDPPPPAGDPPGQDQHHHRAPHLYPPGCRPDHRHRRGAHRRAAPTRSCWTKTASMPICTNRQLLEKMKQEEYAL